MENHGGMILTGEKLLIRLPALSGYPISESSNSKAGGSGEGNYEFSL